MAKKKISRKELLKGSDEFISISTQVADFAKAHRQPLQYAGIAIAVLVIAYFAAHAWMGSMNEEAQTAYNTATQILLNGSMKPGADPADLQKAEGMFSDIIKNYSMSDVGRLAAPPAAYVKFLEKDYPEAIRLYTKFLHDVSGDTQCEFLTKLAMATCYEESGDLKTAIETLAPMVKSDSDMPFRDSAMWNLARLYRLDNSTEKEKEILKKFVERYKDSPFHTMAEADLKSAAN